MTHELLFFLQSVLWGAGLLFFYDLLRIGRRLFPRHALLVSLEDLAYWSLAGIFLFGKMYQANEGKIRGYSILAVALGMTLYAYAVSGRFVSMAVRILEIPLKFLLSVEKRLLFAVKHCKISISKKLRAVRRGFLRKFGKLKRGGKGEKKSGDQAQKAK